jgi:hypothetical protein
MEGGMPGAQTAVPSDAWLVRFMDVTTQPGYAYKYRVRVKVYNPNHRRPAHILAMPTLAKEEEIRSDWFELKDLVHVPKDEFIYAGSNDPQARPTPKVTERVPVGNTDETWLQVHKWFATIQPRGWTRAEPLGEWVVADIRAVRGQVLSDAPKVELPIWSMTKAMFLFRNNPPPRGRAVRRDERELRSWEVDLTPQPEQLVVDFEGGYSDQHPGYKGRAVRDTTSMDVLLLDDKDGKLRLLRSAVDLADGPDQRPRSKERADRHNVWLTWLQEVAQNTLMAAQQGGNPFGEGGMPGAPGGPGGGAGSPDR